jgi:4-hydroxythreonine-4-phosphate dehydrogenase
VKPLAITLGDPAGIGPEIIEKALASLEVPFRLFGRVPSGVRYGEISGEYGRIALDAIDEAVTAVERGECSALVTAPIHKQSAALAGSPHPGHTELLAARAGLTRYAWDYAMYFDSPRLRTVLLSVHVPLREAIDTIAADRVAALAALLDREYPRLHGVRPRIAVAGVNPHAGEGGRFGQEETAIAEGVAMALKAGADVSGPHPPDTVFLAASGGRYDVVMAMYHDQGLIPVKTLAFEQSVNITLGLPYLRVSVDHGTAFDIAGKGIADPTPMRYAIDFAARHAGGFSS